MLCENCKKNIATAFSSVLIDKDWQELYLCSDCLLNKKDSFIKFEKQEENTFSAKKCVCKTTFKEIAESGFVGCKTCYETFENELRPMILTLHTKDRHTGKRKLSKLEILLEQLEKAKNNNFVSLVQKLETEIAKLKGVSDV